MDKTQPLADIVAYHDNIRFQRLPTVRARRVVKLEAILLLGELDLKDEWLINVAEERDRVDIVTSTQSPGFAMNMYALDSSLIMKGGAGFMYVDRQTEKGGGGGYEREESRLAAFFISYEKYPDGICLHIALWCTVTVVKWKCIRAVKAM